MRAGLAIAPLATLPRGKMAEFAFQRRSFRPIRCYRRMRQTLIITPIPPAKEPPPIPPLDPDHGPPIKDPPPVPIPGRDPPSPLADLRRPHSRPRPAS